MTFLLVLILVRLNYSFFSTCFNTDVDPLQSPSPACDVSLLCTPEEVFELISHTDCSKASGPDGISGRMLKGVASSIASPLCKLFNMSLSTSTIPVEWKTSNVVPVFKSGQHGLASNYRPISLLCVVSKLLEKHIYSILEVHIDQAHLLSDSKCSFCHHHSTNSLLISITHNWISFMESGLSVGAVFFDLNS